MDRSTVNPNATSLSSLTVVPATVYISATQFSLNTNHVILCQHLTTLTVHFVGYADDSRACLVFFRNSLFRMPHCGHMYERNPRCIVYACPESGEIPMTKHIYRRSSSSTLGYLSVPPNP